MATYALPLGISRAMVVVGVLFNVQHWPAAGLLLLLGATGCAVFSSLRFAALPVRSLADVTRLVFGIAFPALVVFTLLHWPYKAIPLVLSAVSLVVGSFVSAWTSTSPAGGRSVAPPLYFTLGMVCVLGGVVFRIQHWPYSSALILVGLGCCAAWIVQDHRAASKAANGDGTDDNGGKAGH